MKLKQYASLDDKTLKDMREVGIKSLSEARLDFQAVTFLFLPHEHDDLKGIFQAAVKSQAAKQIHLAACGAFEPLIAALDKTKASYSIYNSAVALSLMLSIFQRHIEDLTEGWLAEGSEEILHKGPVPIETVLGTDLVSTETAFRLRRYVEQAISRGKLDVKKKQHVLDLLLDGAEGRGAG